MPGVAVRPIQMKEINWWRCRPKEYEGFKAWWVYYVDQPELRVAFWDFTYGTQHSINENKFAISNRLDVVGHGYTTVPTFLAASIIAIETLERLTHERGSTEDRAAHA